jgi:hypothetical protein
MILATYDLQVVSAGQEGSALTQDDKRVLANLPAMLEAVEEDLTALLPPGYEAVIKEWNDE